VREWLARLIPGAFARLRPGQEAEYEAAVKEFLLVAATLDDADGPAPAPTAEPTLEPVDANPEAEPRGATPADRPALEPARWRRRRPGETAPDHLLRAPGSVDLATDGFLDGLVRRIEGDR
jgi:hypothetical protein